MFDFDFFMVAAVNVTKRVASLLGVMHGIGCGIG